MASAPATAPEPLLRDYLDVLRRRWMVIAACTVVGAALGLLFGISRNEVYTSQSTILLLPVPSDQAASVGGKSRAVNLETQRSLIRSQPVTTVVAEALGEDSFQAVRKATRVGVDAASDVLKINYTAATPEKAKAGAEEVASAFLTYRRQLAVDVVAAEKERTQKQVADLQGQLEDVTGRLAELDRDGVKLTDTQREERATLQAREEVLKQQLISLRNDLFGPEVSVEPGRVIDEPTLAPSKDMVRLPFLAGGALGLLVGLFTAFLRDRFDGSFRVARTGSAVGRRVVGSVPPVPPGTRVRLDQPEDGHRRLGLTLLSLDHGQRKAVVVADIDGSDWTAPVAIAQVGALLARTDHPTTIIDGDLEHGVITEALGLQGQPGVGDLVGGLAALPAAPAAGEGGEAPPATRPRVPRRMNGRAVHVDGIERLAIVPRGAAGAPVDVLLSGRFRKLVAEVGEASDLVLVSAPPLSSSSIAIGLASELDGLVLIVRPDSAMARVDEAAADLDRLGGRLLAIVEASGDEPKPERRGLLRRRSP